MNGFRSDDDLRLVNERIHAMHVDAARQRLVRQAVGPGADGGVAPVARGRRPRHGPAACCTAGPRRWSGDDTDRLERAGAAFDRMGACV